MPAQNVVTSPDNSTLLPIAAPEGLSAFAKVQLKDIQPATPAKYQTWREVTDKFPKLANLRTNHEYFQMLAMLGAEPLLFRLSQGHSIHKLAETIDIPAACIQAFLAAQEDGENKIRSAEEVASELHMDKAMEVLTAAELHAEDQNAAAVSLAKAKADLHMKMAAFKGRRKNSDSEATQGQGRVNIIIGQPVQIAAHERVVNPAFDPDWKHPAKVSTGADHFKR